MLDKILAAISLLALISFLAIVVVYVREPDLTVVVVVVMAMAVYDFWLETSKGKNSNQK